MQKLVEGMGIFWKKFQKPHIDSLYLLTMPDAEEFIKSLKMTGSTTQEGKIATWFRLCNGNKQKRTNQALTVHYRTCLLKSQIFNSS